MASANKMKIVEVPAEFGAWFVRDLHVADADVLSDLALSLDDALLGELAIKRLVSKSRGELGLNFTLDDDNYRELLSDIKAVLPAIYQTSALRPPLTGIYSVRELGRELREVLQLGQRIMDDSGISSLLGLSEATTTKFSQAVRNVKNMSTALHTLRTSTPSLSAAQSMPDLPNEDAPPEAAALGAEQEPTEGLHKKLTELTELNVTMGAHMAELTTTVVERVAPEWMKNAQQNRKDGTRALLFSMFALFVSVVVSIGLAVYQIRGDHAASLTEAAHQRSVIDLMQRQLMAAEIAQAAHDAERAATLDQVHDLNERIDRILERLPAANVELAD